MMGKVRVLQPRETPPVYRVTISMRPVPQHPGKQRPSGGRGPRQRCTAGCVRTSLLSRLPRLQPPPSRSASSWAERDRAWPSGETAAGQGWGCQAELLSDTSLPCLLPGTRPLDSTSRACGPWGPWYLFLPHSQTTQHTCMLTHMCIHASRSCKERGLFTGGSGSRERRGTR